MASKLIIHRGITFDNSFEILSVNPTTLVEIPINLTGKIVVFEMLKGFAASLVLLSNAPPNAYGSALTVTNATLGRFTVKITDEQTALAKVGVFHWTAFYIDSNGDQILLSNGNMEVLNR